METYDPTNDILAFGDYAPPWVRVAGAMRPFRSDLPDHYLRHTGEVIPLAYNPMDRLVLLFCPNGSHALFVCRSLSPDGPYGHAVDAFESIADFIRGGPEIDPFTSITGELIPRDAG